MKPTEYIWHNGKLIKWDDAKVHVLTHALHYGSGAFEGIRAYETSQGAAVFRLREHMQRLQYSAKALAMEIPWTLDQMCDAVVELLRANKVKHGYIRPLAFYGYGVMGLKPYGAPVELMIATWPWGAYLPHEAVDVKTSSYVRIHQRSTVVDAKICGHYINSIMASLEIRGTDFHEALLLDADGFVAEGPGENLFLVKNGTLITPKRGTILAGITRDTVLKLAEHEGIGTAEQQINREDILAAEEAFFTGTAAEVTPVRSLDKTLIGKGQVGPISQLIKTRYHECVTGSHPLSREFLTYIQ